jgi:hypothetical protein
MNDTRSPASSPPLVNGPAVGPGLVVSLERLLVADAQLSEKIENVQTWLVRLDNRRRFVRRLGGPALGSPTRLNGEVLVGSVARCSAYLTSSLVNSRPL